MGKMELVDLVAEKTTLTKQDSALAIKAVFESVLDIIKEGQSLTITGFGKFRPTEEKPKTYKITRPNGQVVSGTSEPSKSMRFKVASTVKKELNA